MRRLNRPARAWLSSERKSCSPASRSLAWAFASAISFSVSAFSFCRASAIAAVSASVARIRPHTAAMIPTTNANMMRPAARTGPRCRRTIFLSRYRLDGGRASTGSSFRYRCTSAAIAEAVSYRRLRSFSSDFITIQSSSPWNNWLNRPGSLRRLADTVAASSPMVLMRVLGRGGSSSRMMRRISSNATVRSRSCSQGVVLVSNSYSRMPSE
jgi:hypothetical protein